MVKRIGGEWKFRELNSEFGVLIICSLTNTESNGKSIMIRCPEKHLHIEIKQCGFI